MLRSLVPFFATALAVSAPALSSEIVPLPHFKSIDLRGGGRVTLVPGPTQRLAILEGSSKITRLEVEPDGQLVIDTCNTDCPRSYRLSVEIQSPQVPNLGVNGGGRISIMNGFGAQRALSAAVNGGGSIDSKSVEADNVSAAVNGGGELLVHAGTMLTGAVNGGGHVRYWGNPHLTVAVHGGGSVVRGD